MIKRSNSLFKSHSNQRCKQANNQNSLKLNWHQLWATAKTFESQGDLSPKRQQAKTRGSSFNKWDCNTQRENADALTPLASFLLEESEIPGVSKLKINCTKWRENKQTNKQTHSYPFGKHNVGVHAVQLFRNPYGNIFLQFLVILKIEIRKN